MKTFLVFLFSFFFVSTGYASSYEHRYALVIGINDYKKGHELENSVNDAKAMSAKLNKLGFLVTESLNVSSESITGQLNSFVSKVTPGSMVALYFSGHGMQIKGKNFLLLKDLEKLKTFEDIASKSFSLDTFFLELKAKKPQYIITFLDACRDNPLQKQFNTVGLAEVSAPAGSLISLSTKPGGVSYDLAGVDKNSLYTKHLLSNVEAENTPIDQLLKRVNKQVYIESKSQVETEADIQEPWVQSSIYDDVYFKLTQSTQNLGNEKADTTKWFSVKDNQRITEIVEYIIQYPNGRYIVEAKEMIANLSQPLTTTNQLVSKPEPVQLVVSNVPEVVAESNNQLSIEEKNDSEQKISPAVKSSELKAIAIEETKPVEFESPKFTGSYFLKNTPSVYVDQLNSIDFFQDIAQFLKQANTPAQELHYFKDKNPLAKAWLCALSTHERYKFPMRAKDGVQLCQDLAQQNHAIGQYLLGRAYYYGRGVEQSYSKAFEHVSSAAQSGNAIAMNALGDLYALGKSVEQHHETAVQWYQKSAELGSADGQNSLAVAYLTGEGIAQNKPLAAHWYEQAAQQKHIWASNNLGAMLLLGKDVPRDMKRAYDLIHYAANEGNVQAYLLMGSIYETGMGQTKNKQEAKKWYQKAFEQADDAELRKIAENSLRRVGK